VPSQLKDDVGQIGWPTCTRVAADEHWQVVAALSRTHSPFRCRLSPRVRKTSLQGHGARSGRPQVSAFETTRLGNFGLHCTGSGHAQQFLTSTGGIVPFSPCLRLVDVDRSSVMRSESGLRASAFHSLCFVSGEPSMALRSAPFPIAQDPKATVACKCLPRRRTTSSSFARKPWRFAA
jgi:hypothetical protein